MAKRRVRGESYEDTELLVSMAILLLTKQAGSIRDAARQMAAKAQGASKGAIVDRLRDKYAARREEVEAIARARLAPQRKRQPSIAKVESLGLTKVEPLDLTRPRSAVEGLTWELEHSAIAGAQRLLKEQHEMLNPQGRAVEDALKEDAIEGARRLLKRKPPG